MCPACVTDNLLRENSWKFSPASSALCHMSLSPWPILLCVLFAVVNLSHECDYMLIPVHPPSDQWNIKVVLGTLIHTINQLKVTTVYIIFPSATSSGKGEEKKVGEE